MNKGKAELELEKVINQYKEILLGLSKEEIFEEASSKYKNWDDVKDLIKCELYTEEEVRIKTIPLLIKNKVESML